MLLGRNWKIESDNLNITLFERHINRKTGRDYWREHSYYSSVANALHAIVDTGIRQTGLKDLETVNAKIEELHRLIDCLALEKTGAIAKTARTCAQADKRAKVSKRPANG